MHRECTAPMRHGLPDCELPVTPCGHGAPECLKFVLQLSHADRLHGIAKIDVNIRGLPVRTHPVDELLHYWFGFTHTRQFSIRPIDDHASPRKTPIVIMQRRYILRGGHCQAGVGTGTECGTGESGGELHGQECTHVHHMIKMLL